jgi:hypothetical protein
MAGAAGIGLALLAASWRLPETVPAARRQPPRFARMLTDSATLLRDRQFAGNAIAVALSTAALFTYISSLPFIVEDSYRQSPQRFSLIFAVNALGLMAVGQLSARLVRRNAPAKLLRTALGVQAGAAVLIAAASLGRPPLLWLLAPMFTSHRRRRRAALAAHVHRGDPGGPDGDDHPVFTGLVDLAQIPATVLGAQTVGERVVAVGRDLGVSPDLEVALRDGQIEDEQGAGRVPSHVPDLPARGVQRHPQGAVAVGQEPHLGQLRPASWVDRGQRGDGGIQQVPMRVRDVGHACLQIGLRGPGGAAQHATGPVRRRLCAGGQRRRGTRCGQA